MLFTEVAPGAYRVRFELDASTFARFFERGPAPFRTAVYSVGPGSRDRLADLASLCFGVEFREREWFTVESPDYRRPLREGMHPPWWLSIPGAGHRASELRFVLAEPGDVCVLLHYDGPAEVELNEVVLYRETYDRGGAPRR